MTITFSCNCGKLIHVKDEFAGERTKCPACASPLVVPQVTFALGADWKPDEELPHGKELKAQKTGDRHAEPIAVIHINADDSKHSPHEKAARSWREYVYWVLL